LTKIIETKVTIKNGNELWNALTAVSEKFAKKALRAALYAGSEVIRLEIGKRAPKDTGRLEAHIAAKTTISAKQEAGKTQIGPGRSAWYAGFLEFGTRKMAARPFIRPAFDSVKQAALNAFVNKMREIFNEEMSKVK
jgi:HK97 gp10 family phage protein